MLSLKEIDEKEKWNNFIKDQKYSHILQTYEWGEFKLLQGWKPRRFILEENGEIKVAYPILEKKIPLINSKFWYLPRGPVWNFQNQQLLNQVLDNLLGTAKENKIAAVKISPGIILNKDTEQIISFLMEKGFQERKNRGLYECTILINLERSLDEIFSNFKKNTRWEIRRAQKDGVKVRRAKGEEGFKIFYQLYLKALKGDKVDILPYGYFKNFLKIFKNNTLVLIAFLDKIPLSTAFISSFNKKCFYLFGGSTKKYPTHYASQLLQWEAIKWAKSIGCHTYDLYGIPCGAPKSKHDAGILQFKGGFGGEKVELIGELDYIFSPFLSKLLFHYLYPIYKKLRIISAELRRKA